MKQIWDLRDRNKIREYLNLLRENLKGDGWTDEEINATIGG